MKNYSPSFDEYRQSKHFGTLDGMRAIGVVLVIFEHYGGDGLKFLSGWLGVHIFFVMSGFLITTLLLREQDKYGQVSLRDFYIRRVFRILPVYYLILIITTLQTKALGGESWQQLEHALPYYLTLFNEQHFIAPWKMTWTMGIEWKFYLVWPVVAFSIMLTPKRMAIATLAMLFTLNWLWDNPFVSAVHYVVLLAGAIVAILLHNRISFNILHWIMNPAASWILMFAVIAMQLYGIHHIPGPAGAYGGAQGILFYGIVVALFLPTLFGSGPINKILSSRPFVFVGQRSYSLYLVQILAWQALAGIDPTMRLSLTAAVLTTLVGLVFADVLYRYVEQPMIAAGKKMLVKNKFSPDTLQEGSLKTAD